VLFYCRYTTIWSFHQLAPWKQKKGGKRWIAFSVVRLPGKRLMLKNFCLAQFFFARNAFVNNCQAYRAPFGKSYSQVDEWNGLLNAKLADVILCRCKSYTFLSSAKNIQLERIKARYTNHLLADKIAIRYNFWLTRSSRSTCPGHLAPGDFGSGRVSLRPASKIVEP